MSRPTIHVPLRSETRGATVPVARRPDSGRPTEVGTRMTAAAARVLAVLRIGIGFIFLWAFLDKTFALGFSTGKDATTGVVDRFGPAAWIHGGSPTSGFLGHLDGTFAGAFSWMAGHAWADWLFMVGLLAIGLALILGVTLRLAAIAGGLLLVLMWAAELPLATNPAIDEHLLYAVAMIFFAMTAAGDTWGLGPMWSRTKAVARVPWLR